MRFDAALLCLLLAAPSAALAAVPVRLSDGASWNQTITHTRTDVRGAETRTAALKTVLKVTYNQPPAGKPATLREEFVSAEAVQGLTATEAEQAAAQARAVFPAVVEVDESLQPTRVANWPELRKSMVAAFSKLITDPKALATMRGNFANMTDVRAVTFFKEQQLVSLGQGSALGAGQTRTYDDQVPNILGGPPILTHGTLRMDSIDAGGGRAFVTWTQVMDNASASDSVRQTIETRAGRLSGDQAEQARASLAGLSLDRRDACRYEVDVATGLATTADCTSILTSGVPGRLATRTERWLIIQIPPRAN